MREGECEEGGREGKVSLCDLCWAHSLHVLSGHVRVREGIGKGLGVESKDERGQGRRGGEGEAMSWKIWETRVIHQSAFISFAC